jgi:hypothetical protein
VALAYLTRTDRSQKNSEIRDLAAKAIQHQLTTVELKMLVKLITEGGYDRLPDRLRMLLFNHKYMTAEVADLYLNLEELFEEKEMQKYCDVVPTLDRTSIADVICKAVKSELLFDRIKQQIIALIKRQAEGIDSNADTGINVQTVTHHFSKLVDEINISQEKIIALSKDNPKQLEYFRLITQKLIKHLKDLLANVEPDINSTGN